WRSRLSTLFPYTTLFRSDLAFLNEWLLVKVTEVPSDLSALVWDGARLFQAARFVTEMEYQHLVFEEFARKMQPDIDAFLFEPDPDRKSTRLNSSHVKISY